VAALPSPGPSDLIRDGVNGALGDELKDSCLRALECSKDQARATALAYGWPASHDVFRNHLVRLSGNGPLAFLGTPRIEGALN
jgi:hypothetical protein